ncbi:MAG TPA: polymer-forming cytoskeletal protein [Saprospiraceae bacterium]|nr:polymer-forming cytoskeletal protein [Saprospiraceae bacterium]
MFGNKKKKQEIPPKKMGGSPKTAGLNSLVQQTNLEGTIQADSDFRVDGTIKGTLNCTAKVIIGPTGAVEGNIKCQNAVIEGRFSGDLRVAESLTVKESAQLSGDVYTATLTVQPGAAFNVVCKMTKGAAGTKTATTEKKKVLNA